MIPLAHVGGGAFGALQMAPVLLAAILYVVRCRTLAASGQPVPVWRQACFGTGLLILFVALASPVAYLGEELVLAHMAQHLLAADLAAGLLVLGLTGPLLAPVLQIKIFDRLRVLTHPLVALPLWAANLYVWHLPVLYQAALASEPVHALQHMMFVGFGVAMWMPLFGPLPTPQWFGLPAKIGYLVAVRLIGTVLANVFMWSGSVFYPDYEPGQAHWGISPLTDQGAAGIVMMVEGGIVTLGLLTWLILLWARQDTERQRLLDLAEERGVALEPARAERAVAAGQGGRLEERLRQS